jgi:orotate phosphoribosyltransferase-like protein
MDVFYFTLILTFAAGVILLMYSAYDFHDAAESDRSEDLGAALEDKIKAIGTSVADADNVIGELSDISGTVFKEMDDKYQELLFLYHLVEEKKKELTKETGGSPDAKAAQKSINIRVTDTLTKTGRSPKYKKISEMESRGLTVGQIAKELHMGQGEVALIMELGKGRSGGRA